MEVDSLKEYLSLHGFCKLESDERETVESDVQTAGTHTFVMRFAEIPSFVSAVFERSACQS